MPSATILPGLAGRARRGLWCSAAVLGTILGLSLHAPADGESLVAFHDDSARVPLLIVHFSGDAGFNVSDRAVARGMLRAHVPTIGINSLRYFSTPRTPESCAADVEQIISEYSAKWHTRECIVIGYSFGAEVVPFIVARMNPQALRRVRLVLCINPSRYADFAFHLGSWVGISATTDRPVVPQVLSLAARIPVVCFYGKDDKESIGPELAAAHIETHVLPGGHRVAGESKLITDYLLARCHAIMAPADSGKR